MKVTRLLLIAIAFLAPRLCDASEIAFQNFVDGASPDNSMVFIGSPVNNQNSTAAQEFTPSIGGAMDSLSAFVTRITASDNPLHIDIRTVGSDGLPGMTLGSVTASTIPLLADAEVGS
jgi:hypothetical protein